MSGLSRTSLFLALVVAAASCGGGQPSSVPGSSKVPTSSSPSRPEPTIGPDDIAAIEKTVRDLLEADRTSNPAELKRLTTDEVAIAESWAARIIANEPQPTAELTVDQLSVDSVVAGEAEVTVEAEIRFAGVPEPLTYQSMSLRLEDGLWKVADLKRDGLVLSENAFTEATGRQERNGVEVEVVGYWRRRRSTLVVATVTNHAADQAIGFRSSLIVGGKQHDGDVGPSSVTVARDAALDTYFYFQGDIPVTGKPRLVTSFTWGSEESSFDIPITLAG